MIRALLLLLLFAALVCGGGMLGFWLYANLIFGLNIKDQPGDVLFPPEMTVDAAATNKIKIKLNGYIDADVPLKQTLNLPLEGAYDADVVIDTWIPVRFTVNYRGVIPVDSMATIEGRTDMNYQSVKRFRNLKFKAQVPLKFEQPVVFSVPVDTKIRFTYRGPLRMALKQTVLAPVDTVLKTRLLAVRDIETPILARFGLRMRPPTTPVPVIIQNADLRMHLDTLRLERAPDLEQPQRSHAAPASSLTTSP